MLKPQLTRGNSVMIVNDDDWPGDYGTEAEGCSECKRAVCAHVSRGTLTWPGVLETEKGRWTRTLRSHFSRAERSDPSRKYVGFDLRAARGCWLAGRRTDGRMCRRIDYFTLAGVAPEAVAAARTIVDLMMGNGNCDSSAAASSWLSWLRSGQSITVSLPHLDPRRQLKSCSLN